jgi:hypothetical protein
VGSGATMCPAAPDLASLVRRTTVLPRVPRPRTSPPCRGEFQCCHVSLGLRPHLLDEVSSDAVTCPIASGSASLRGELWCCHVSHDPVLCLPERGALVLPRVLQPSRAVDQRNKERLSYRRHAARLAYLQGTLMHY